MGVGWKHALPESESEMYLFDPYNYMYKVKLNRYVSRDPY